MTGLTALPKVGRATANRIIDARPFQSVDELKAVPGITEALFGELRPLVSL